MIVSRRIAIDFGTSNTVLAAFDEVSADGKTVHIPDLGRYLTSDTGISVVPSVIHYGDNSEILLGDQVIEKNLYHSPKTFRWMKRYIQDRSPTKRRLNGRQISNTDAGKDFITKLLDALLANSDRGSVEVAVTVPVESFEDYEDWLNGVADDCGLQRLRLIDEPVAAALGYGARIRPNDACLVFDFGAGTLDVAIVIFGEPDELTGSQCRVLGKAGAELGGRNINQWIFEHALKQNDLSTSDSEVDYISGELLRECEKAKEKLSQLERTEISVMNTITGAIVHATLTQEDLERLLEDNNVFQIIDSTISRAMRAASLKGFEKDDIKTVLLVGGGSYIPCVQRALRRMFGKERVLLDRPMDAVARGAAKLLSGAQYCDYIQHDYAIRYMNSLTGNYDYKPIVKAGTPYPSMSVARISVKATYDGQKHFGLAIFEIARKTSAMQNASNELVFDANGFARIVRCELTDFDRNHFWLNENSPTLLTAEPVGSKGDVCFFVEFSIDDSCRLVITARDARSSKVIYDEYPVVKLQ